MSAHFYEEAESNRRYLMEITSTELTEDGSVYAYDRRVDASYVNVQPVRPNARVGRTVDLGGGIHIDYTTDGEFYGIERIGGPMERWVLMRVIRHLAAPSPHLRKGRK